MLNATLRQLIAPYRRRLGVAVGLQALAGLCGLVPWLVLSQLAASTEPPGYGQVVPAAVGLMLWLLCQGLALHLTHLVDADLCAQLRQRLLSHLHTLPLGWFSHHGQDEVARLVEQDVRALHQLVAHAPTDLTNLAIVPISIMLYLAWLQPWLLLLVLLPLALAILCYRLIRSGRYQTVATERDRTMAQLSQQYGELAQNLVLVRQYPHSGIQQQVSASASAFEQAFVRWVNKVGRQAALADTLLASPCLVAWLLLASWGLASINDGLAVGAATFCTFVLMLRAMAAPIQAMGHGGDALAQAQAAADRLQTLLQTPALAEGQSQRLPQDASIEVSQLAYHCGDKALLQDLSFTLEAGSLNVVVGPSGSGKTTLLHLLARFMDPSSGHILIGGEPLVDLPSDLRQRQITIMLQQAAALDLSIAANIALLAPEASRSDIEAAAAAACLDATIAAWPHGYASLANHEVILSGGERQRLALARLFLAAAPILLLDEPTSAIDAATAQSLQQAMRQHFASKTVLMTAHRLAEVCDADQILVLAHGRIVERGRHTELLALNGLYAQLWQEQQEATL